MQPSIITIDASHYRTAHPTGVEVYVDELLPRLVPILVREGYDVQLLRSESLPAQDVLAGYVVRLPYRRGWGQTVVGSYVHKLRPKLYFTPSGIPPVLSSVPVAVTVHDISVYDSPESYSLPDRLRHTALLRHSAKRARIVLVPSKYVAETLIKRWRLSQDSLVITPLARQLSEEVKAQAPAFSADIQDPLYVFVGRLEEKKQLRQVVAGFAAYVRAGGAGSLVLAGGNGHGIERLRALVESLDESVKARILLPGYVSREALAYLLTRATALLVPSPYEGFGIPVLEGFAVSVPVIASGKGAAAEVGADAVLSVGSGTADDWTAAFNGITDEKLRETLISRGLARLEKYSWETTASATATALLRAASMK
jgi:alpha-1,3-rhamnosyl/mannosyltransferase